MPTFNTDEERMRHPQAKLIPDFMWKSDLLFGKTLEDALIPLMTAPNEELSALLATLKIEFTCNGYKTWLAIALSHSDLNLETLKELAIQLSLDSTNIFELLVTLGNEEHIMVFMKEQSTTDIEAIIKDIYQRAAQNDHLGVLRYLEAKAPKLIQKMIQAEIFDVYQKAAENGHLEVLQHLETQAPNLIHDMIQARNFSAYQWAAENGHLDVLQHLETKAPNLIQAMVQADDFLAYRLAARNDHLGVLQHLETKAPNLIQKMIQAESFDVYQKVAENGHLDVLQHLETKAPNFIQAMIQANNFSAYRLAAANGHLDVLQHLETKTPNYIQAMIKANNFSAYQWAAESGHLDVLQHMETKAPNFIRAMIQANNFYAYRRAAENRHLEVLKNLEAKAPDLIQAMIQENYFYAYRKAAENGHLDVLQHMETKAPNFIQEMIQAANFSAYQRAFYAKHFAIAKHTISQSSACFAYAEMHVTEYGENVVNPWIGERLAALHQAVGATDAHGVFDITDVEQAKIGYYMARNLIRRNDRALDGELQFLLTIPSVKALVHTEMTEGQANELFRLALSRGNQEAAALLLTIPAVHRLAEANNYYRNEIRGGVDVRQLAQDRESSMTALTQGEQQRLNEAIVLYQPMLKQASVSNLMDALREELKARYDQKPASIDDESGKHIELPFAFKDLQALNLKALDYQKALKAYYQHKDHSAWRYLSKPNRWMNEQASYVYISDDHRERWSTYEEYQPLIAMLWLAARDKESAPTEGHTLEGRLEHFISELALIGRAHNWDASRTNQKGKDEEYDDLTGDRPSCFSGVKRRLFQSVIGHPKISILSADTILAELRDFVKGYFESQINERNQQQYLDAFNDYFVSLEAMSEDSKAFLTSLNIPEARQQEFALQMSNKYGAQYDQDPELRRLVKEKLQLNPNSSAISSHYHATHLDGLVHLYDKLNEVTKRVAESMDWEGTHLTNEKQSPSEETAAMDLDKDEEVDNPGRGGMKRARDENNDDSSARKKARYAGDFFANKEGSNSSKQTQSEQSLSNSATSPKQ